jgi:hypothetical protein
MANTLRRMLLAEPVELPENPSEATSNASRSHAQPSAPLADIGSFLAGTNQDDYLESLVFAALAVEPIDSSPTRFPLDCPQYSLMKLFFLWQPWPEPYQLGNPAKADLRLLSYLERNDWESSQRFAYSRLRALGVHEALASASSRSGDPGRCLMEHHLAQPFDYSRLRASLLFPFDVSDKKSFEMLTAGLIQTIPIGD